MSEPVIRAMPGGEVQVEIDQEENTRPAHVVYELGMEMLEAAFLSQAIRLLDDVMDRNRRLYVDGQAEWELLTQVWRELRLALGYDDGRRY